jgi:regulator of sigma E protease
MTPLIAIAAFVVTLGILVTFHELGHYWAARWCDVRVIRFSVGFGKPLFMRKLGPDKTEWVIAALPLGGFVRMADERDGSAHVNDGSRAFNKKTVWQRMFITVAGPLANFVLAALFYWVLFVSGTPGIKAYVSSPPPATAAARAGLAEFDLITRIGDREVVTWGDARLALLDAAVKRGVVEVEVERTAAARDVLKLDASGIDTNELDKDFAKQLGVVIYRPKGKTQIEAVQAKSVAATADLRVGDVIVAAQGKTIERPADFQELAYQSPDKPIELTIERGAERFNVTVTPERIKEQGQTFGRIGVGLKPLTGQLEQMRFLVRYGPIDSIGRAIGKVWEMSIFSLKMMGRMITGDISWKNLSGPVTIADYAGQSAQLGLIAYINFLALISISLGVLNLLPIPVLDGGQLMYYTVEVFKGSPVSERTMEIGQQVGLTLLLGMTAFAFYNDIHRLFAG